MTFSRKNFNNDIKREKFASQFNLTHLSGKDIILKYNEPSMPNYLQNQKKGIDGWLSIPKLNIQNATFDEKCSITWLNYNPGTYLLELHDYSKLGWFLDDSHINEYYIFEYPYSNKKLYWDISSADDFTAMDFWIIKKDIIRNFVYNNFKEFGIDKNTIHKIAMLGETNPNYIPNSKKAKPNKQGTGYSINLGTCNVNGQNITLYLKYTHKKKKEGTNELEEMPEHPINLSLTLNFYDMFSTVHGKITNKLNGFII